MSVWILLLATVYLAQGLEMTSETHMACRAWRHALDDLAMRELSTDDFTFMDGQDRYRMQVKADPLYECHTATTWVRACARPARRSDGECPHCFEVHHLTFDAALYGKCGVNSPERWHGEGNNQQYDSIYDEFQPYWRHASLELTETEKAECTTSVQAEVSTWKLLHHTFNWRPQYVCYDHVLPTPTLDECAQMGLPIPRESKVFAFSDLKPPAECEFLKDPMPHTQWYPKMLEASQACLFSAYTPACACLQWLIPTLHLLPPEWVIFPEERVEIHWSQQNSSLAS